MHRKSPSKAIIQPKMSVVSMIRNPGLNVIVKQEIVKLRGYPDCLELDNIVPRDSLLPEKSLRKTSSED